MNDEMIKMINSYSDFKTALLELKQQGYNNGAYSDGFLRLFDFMVMFGADEVLNQALIESGYVDDNLARHPLSTLDELKSNLKTINTMIDSLYSCILADQQYMD